MFKSLFWKLFFTYLSILVLVTLVAVRDDLRAGG